MNETKYRKMALRVLTESREETKEEIVTDVKMALGKFTSLLRNIKSRLTHHKPS